MPTEIGSYLESATPDSDVDGNLVDTDTDLDHASRVAALHDGTEDGIAYELKVAGAPKEHIVLTFKSPEHRKLTEYATV